MTSGSGTNTDPYKIKFYSSGSPNPPYVILGMWYELQNETTTRYEDMKVDNPNVSSNFSIFGDNVFGNCNPSGGTSNSKQQALNSTGPAIIYNNHGSNPTFGTLACVISLDGPLKLSPIHVAVNCDYVFYNNTEKDITGLQVGDKNDSLFGNQWEVGDIAKGAYSSILTVTNGSPGAKGGIVVEPNRDHVGGSSITFGTLTVSSASVNNPPDDDKVA